MEHSNLPTSKLEMEHSNLPTSNTLTRPSDEWEAYRLGDVYWHEWDRLNKNTVKNFPDSIAADYIAQKKERHDIETLADICTYRCGLSHDKTLLHLRLGDSVCKMGSQEESRRPENPELILASLKNLELNKETPIVLVSGSHTDACAEESSSYLRQLVNTLDTAGYSTTIQSQEPDQDFCEMVGASTFIQGKGGFSELVSSVRNEVGMEPSKNIPSLTNYNHMGRGWTSDSL